ncbi:unnamed protein product [Mytilus edulis]|uniref:Uncharacterized protein n=1 Tax=Mytilus edulis TaxID=6550 RepID=A0A8S3SU27_MYTED|nr:unnamed protein product [Mytilus edulis]
MGQPMGIGCDPVEAGMYPNEDYTGEQSQGYGSRYGSSSGRICGTCRRRCRPREWTVRYSCLLPCYPRYLNTCCKYLRNYQTSSMSRGYGGSPYSQYPQSYPGSMYDGQQDPQMTYPTYTTYPGSGGDRLPPILPLVHRFTFNNYTESYRQLSLITVFPLYRFIN